MVEDTGVEPMTFCLQSRRSTNWANPPARNGEFGVWSGELLGALVGILLEFTIYYSQLTIWVIYWILFLIMTFVFVEVKNWIGRCDTFACCA